MDAAVCMPVFILSFVLILSLIYQASDEDEIFLKLTKRANAAFAVVGAADMDVPYLVAMDSTKKNNVVISLYYRPFVGESAESRERNMTVYVYPNYGIRFHVKGCSTVDNNSGYERMTKSEAQERGYTPCLLCCPDGIDYFKKKEPFPGPFL